VTKDTVKAKDQAPANAGDDLAKKLAANFRFKEAPKAQQGFMVGASRKLEPPPPSKRLAA
jgi:hypothetical protein